MSPKIRIHVLAAAALAAVLTTSPAQAAGPQLREGLRVESPWQAVADFWAAAASQVVSWWKQAPPPAADPRAGSCHTGNRSCSFKPGSPGDVGSAIDPDGRPF